MSKISKTETIQVNNLGIVRMLKESGKIYFSGNDVAKLLGRASFNEKLQAKAGSLIKRRVLTYNGVRNLLFISLDNMESMLSEIGYAEARELEAWLEDNFKISEIEKENEVEKEKENTTDISSCTVYSASQQGILNIKGVDCYYGENGTAYLKLEAVARGLGFTQTQNKNGVEYTSIRWETVNRYLEDIGFPNKLGKDDFIPENIFYRLAMKAKNETAEKFQALVADEIIPTIRKQGYYGNIPVAIGAKEMQEMANAVTNAVSALREATNTLQSYQQNFESFQNDIEILKNNINNLQKNLSSAHYSPYREKILCGLEFTSISDFAKDYGASGAEMNRKLYELGILTKIEDNWVISKEYEDKDYVIVSNYNGLNGRTNKPVSYSYYKWSRAGRLFLYETLKANGILPLMERTSIEEATNG